MAKRKETIVIIPGSFAPLHRGHLDLMYKVSHLADYVVLAVGQNPEKKVSPDFSAIDKEFKDKEWIKVKEFSGSFPDFVNTISEGYDVVAVVRGLRNPNDFLYEQSLLYTYEDLGLNQLATPVLYLIADRSEVHISSTVEREKAKLERK